MYNHVCEASLRKDDGKDDRIVVPLDDLLQWNLWPQFLKICCKCTVCDPHPLANILILQMALFFTYIYYGVWSINTSTHQLQVPSGY